MQILILGAGYAGLRVVLELNKLVSKEEMPAQVTLLDQNPYHQIVQELHLTATTRAEPSDTVLPLADLLSRCATRLEQGRVARIEPPARQVHLEDGRSIGYDRLVIALGAETNYSDIPGAREHTLPLRSQADALQLREHLQAQFAEAARTDDPAVRQRLLTFAIVGGGYTGSQLAGELAAWCKTRASQSGLSTSEVHIALIERNAMLLRQFGAWATQYAEYVLARRGIDIYRSTAVERVEAQTLSLSGNRVLHAGTIVWAGGIRAPALLAASDFPTDRIGRVRVDRYLRVQDQALIFAAGDCAGIPDPLRGTLPATASFAMRQGEHLARTLLAECMGQAPRSYQPLRLGELVSLGPGEAIGNPLGVPTFGLPAATLKKGIEVWYRTTLGC
jgi:NADH:ubiquinone reductase (H+-translocating)